MYKSFYNLILAKHVVSQTLWPGTQVSTHYYFSATLPVEGQWWLAEYWLMSAERSTKGY